jgi:predicted metalloprotease with PDZ domain
MKSKLLAIALVFISVTTWASDGKYEYRLDLTRVVDDKVYVELSTPDVSESEIIFYMPKMIPGTYAIEDYGRFVSDFQAFDKKGRSLTVTKSGTNSWTISKANKMVKISYWIQDTFHSSLEGPDIFEPAGTNIEENTNFVINSSGFFGYFDSMKELEYNVQIVRPDNFYGSTGLIPVTSNAELTGAFSMEDRSFDDKSRVDHFRTSRYDDLVDSPIMYCEPDTVVMNVGGATVLVSSYSPNSAVSAKQIGNTIEEILIAQKNYLGGTLPVDKYAFIFYFIEEQVMMYGALEHSYSSFYYMPEMAIEDMNQQLRDFAAHEFFHIVTPLNVHSEEIGFFDFNDPKMSKHLWLYEGMTEYFAGNAQVKNQIIDVEEYIDIIRTKMLQSQGFNDTLAFTELSLGALDLHEDQYYNVYLKGALIGMCLDILLRDLSDGAYGTQELLADLSKEYGKDNSFKDDELFDKITELTYPEVRVFFANYVEGKLPLPYKETFEKVGINFESDGVYMDYSLGITQANIGIDMESGKIFIQNEEGLDAQGKALGLKDGDVLMKINGEDMPQMGPDLQNFIIDVLISMGEKEAYTMTVLRKNEAEEAEEVMLSTTPILVERNLPYVMTPNEAASPKAVATRAAWLGLE